MANKKINELLSRTPSLSDLMLVGDPSSGYSYKCTVHDIANIIESDIGDAYVTLTTTQSISGAKTFSNVLTLTSVANSAVDTDKFLVLTGTNTVNYRTGAEVLSDIGGASASSISGTTNYVAKFTSSSAIGNSLIFDNGTNVGISTTSPSYKLDVSGTLRSTNSSYFATGGGNIGIGTNSVTGIGGPILQIHASTFPEIHLTNSTTGDQFQDGTSIHVSGSSLNILNYESGNINFSTSGTQRVSIASDGNVTLSVIANATTDTDRFLVSDSGVIKYRTGAELLSDIGGQGSLSLSAIGSTPNANGATLSSNTLTLQPASASFGGVVTTGFQEFAGQKRFVGNPIQFDKHLEIKNNNSWSVSWGYTSFASKDTPVFGFLRGHSFSPTPTSYNAWFTYGTTGDRNYTLPSSDGTLALTSDITGAISGTTNYIPKFTSSSAIGNSTLFDNGSNIGLGTASPSASYRVTISGSTYQVGTNSKIYIDNGGVGGASAILGVVGSSYGYLNTDGGFPFVFQTNNTERMRLDASGNLGLGTSSPAYKLDVQGGADLLQLRRTSVRDFGFQITSSGALNIYDETANADRLTLDASGNLGLGVSPSNAYSDSRAFEIGASGILWTEATPSVYNSLGMGVNFYYDAAGNVKYKNTGVNATRYSQYYGQHQWFTAPSGTAGNAISFTQAMTLDASGRLGIGTTSPESLLHIAQGNSGGIVSLFVDNNINALNSAAQIKFTVDAGGSLTSGGAAIRAVNVDPNYATTDLLFLTSGGGLSEKMRLDASGRLGIGTTSPAVKLHVASSGYGEVARFFDVAGYGISLTADANSGYNQITSTGGQPFLFSVNGSERMRITSGGNVGIGTSSPSATLHVNGTIKTAAPSGFTAGAWKLGDVTVTSITVDTDKYISVDINGTVYNIPTCHPN